MKKIGMLLLALVVVLGGLGVGYAQLTQTLTINATVNTGSVDAFFLAAVSNDETGSGTLDPSAAGSWNIGAPGFDPASTATWVWTGTDWGFDGASTDTAISGNLDLGIETYPYSVYPSYWSNVAYSIENSGTVPFKFGSVQLVSFDNLDAPGGNPVTNDISATPLTIVPGTRYYVDNVGTNVDTTNNGVEAFSFIVDQIDPLTPVSVGGHLMGTSIFHIEDSAEQAAPYGFVLHFNVVQFNAP